MIPRGPGAQQGYGIEPYEPDPSEQRTMAVVKMLMGLGYDERRAYQMANKITGLGEGIAEMTPFAMELAEERGEPTLNSALLSGLPGAMLIKQLARNTNKVKQIDNALIMLNSKMNERGSEKAYRKLMKQKEKMEAEKRFLEKEAESLKHNSGDMFGRTQRPIKEGATEDELNALKKVITEENKELNNIRDIFKDFE